MCHLASQLLDGLDAALAVGVLQVDAQVADEVCAAPLSRRGVPAMESC
jgi:hypothetical protein